MVSKRAWCVLACERAQYLEDALLSLSVGGGSVVVPVGETSRLVILVIVVVLVAMRRRTNVWCC
jgi:hypothetical protein